METIHVYKLHLLIQVWNIYFVYILQFYIQFNSFSLAKSMRKKCP